MTTEEESEYARGAYETAVYREQLKLLEREIQRIQLTGADLITAAETCKQLESTDGLMPIGGGTYIRAAIQSKKALVPIGGNYLVEIDNDQAVHELNKRVDAARNATEKLKAEYQKIVDKLRETSMRTQELRTKLAISRRVDENIGEDYI